MMNTNNHINNKKINFLPILSICIIVVLLTMMRHFEPSGETWGYWFFADILSNQGEFVIQSRSPLYVLYLQLFNWLGFPFSIYMEWVTTSLITGLSLYLLLRIQLSEWSAIFAVIIWLPFIRYSEPPVQSLALSMTSIAFVIRYNSFKYCNSHRPAIAMSYTFLIMAFMFRVIYILPLVLVVLYDIWNSYKLKGFKNIFLIMPTWKDWHLVIVVIFFIVSSLMISQHPWNNAWFATTNWFPVSGEHTSLGDGGFIQSMNWQYIKYMYDGDFTNHDFYFTNKELFGNATTLLSAFLSNPAFVIEQWWRNILELFDITSDLNLISYLISILIPWVGGFIGTILLLYGAIKSTVSNSQIFLLLIVTILLAGSTAVGLPKMRYMVPVVPFLILGTYWYASVIKKVIVPKIFETRISYVKSLSLLIASMTLITIIFLYLEKVVISGGYISFHPRYNGYFDWLIYVISVVYLLTFVALVSQVSSFSSGKNRAKARKYTTNAIIPALFLSFTPAIGSWINIMSDAITGPKIMTADNFSFLNSKDKILSLGSNCNGVMTMEHNIMAIIFSGKDTKVYDIWEIPPFGNLNDSVYDGLNSNRVNCLFISDGLSKGPTGYATNQTIRYKNYIQLYEVELISAGASTYKIDGYGRAVILKADRL